MIRINIFYIILVKVKIVSLNTIVELYPFRTEIKSVFSKNQVYVPTSTKNIGQVYTTITMHSVPIYILNQGTMC